MAKVKQSKSNKGLSNKPYRSIAKDQPTGARTTGGVDDYRVVGGTPKSQKTPKKGNGLTKNTGKIQGY